MATAIRVKGLGKSYVLRHEQPERYVTLRDALSEGVKRFGRRLLTPRRAGQRSTPEREEFWALRDVDFEIEEGARVGIIGRNGAGKSTLLKILSRITDPSAGRIEMHGRVASLLEVGTGFHPELTGRENIFLNGTILGMSSREIRKRFDEIVAFAEVERFLDTPVKRYSSGMHVRLAFSVAAHLESEILILDEVLAVGDASFQRKCFSRIEQTAASGRTILFVSHSMTAVRRLCSLTAYLDAGRLKVIGPTEHIIQQYLAESLYTEDAERRFSDDAEKEVRIRRVAVTDDAGRLNRNFGLDQQIWLEIDYELKRDVRDCMVIFAVSRDGVYVYQSHDTDREDQRLLQRTAGRYSARIALPRRLLTAGTYSIYPAIAVGHAAQYGHDGQPDAVSFVIGEEDQTTAIDLKSYAQARGSLVIAEPVWHTRQVNSRDWPAQAPSSTANS